MKKISILLIAFMLISVGFLSGCIEQVGISQNNKSPTVTISAEPITGFQPLEVMFDINAIDEDGIIQSCCIDFGDGTDSCEMNPSHTYNAGTYTVIVKAIDEKGAETNKSITIEVKNRNPVANASANPTSGKSPLTVSFTGSGNDSDGTIESYHWDFGDGETSTEQNPTYTFPDDKTYVVKLTVTDNNGATDTDTIEITISPNEPPIASASVDKTSGLGPLTVHFTGGGTDNDGSIESYQWYFGWNSDIPDSYEKNPTVSFQSDGTFNVRLTVTDDKGATAFDTVRIEVERYRMTILEVNDLMHYFNEVRIKVRMEAGTQDLEIHGNFEADTQNNLIYKTTWFEVGYPDVILAGNSADIVVIFQNIPDDIVLVKLRYTWPIKDLELPIPSY